MNSQQNATVMVSNYGKEFFLGFLDQLTSDSFIRLIIAADRNSPVKFDVKISRSVVYSGTTTSHNPVTVDLPSSQGIRVATYSDRNKGVHIHTTGGGLISVLAVYGVKPRFQRRIDLNTGQLVMCVFSYLFDS